MTQQPRLKTTRIDAGYYRVTYRGRSFTVETCERFSDGESTERAWILQEVHSAEYGDADWMGDTSYWNHFCTLWAAKQAIEGQCDEDAEEKAQAQAAGDR